MSVTYDLRSPTFVLVGRWNDAILNEPAWVARHLLEIAENTEIEVRLAIRQAEDGQQHRIWVFDGFALGCTSTRLELYLLAEANYQPLYDVLRRVSEVLPHTPVSGFGTNFRIISDEAVGPLTDALETTENFDTIGITNHIERSETLEIHRDRQVANGEDVFRNCVLRVKRATNFSSALFDFNFHYDIQGMTQVHNAAALELIDHWWTIAREQLATYGIEEWQAQAF